MINEVDGMRQEDYCCTIFLELQLTHRDVAMPSEGDAQLR